MLDKRKEPFILVAFLRRVYYLLGFFVVWEQLNFENGFQKCPFVSHLKKSSQGNGIFPPLNLCQQQYILLELME